jgi:hypothetical protein
MNQQYIELLKELVIGRVQISRVILETEDSGYQTVHEYFTMCPDLVPQEYHTIIDDQVMDENTKTIKAYDCVRKQITEIELEWIVKSTLYGHDQVKEDECGSCCDEIKEMNQAETEIICEGLCCEVDELECCCDESIDRACCCEELHRHGLTGVAAQKLFKFKVDTQCILSALDHKCEDELTEEQMDCARHCYMDLIREHREQSFAELDQLEEESKQAGATAEDLEDINTIKQMFRDIPQDSDLTQYKTLNELLEFWPSLMLPKPKKVLANNNIEFPHDINDVEYEQLAVNREQHMQKMREQQLNEMIRCCSKQDLHDLYIEIKDDDSIDDSLKLIVQNTLVQTD